MGRTAGMKMMSRALLAVALAAVANAQAARSTAARSASAPYLVVQTDAHRPVTYHFAVTNTTDKPQTVESVRSSCACLKVQMGGSRPVATDGRAVSPLAAADATGRVPPGGVLPFDVVLNPAGMEGRVEKRVWVTLAPIGGSPETARPTRIVSFGIAADVRLRLGFKPMDAAFGVIRRSDADREIVAKLSGYVAEDVTLGTPFLATKNAKDAKSNNNISSNSLRLCVSALNNQSAVFDVRLGADGKSIVTKFRERNVLPGIYSETWTIPTSDTEIPEITFAVSARVTDAVSVTPQVITVGWDEPACSRMVMVRMEGGSRSVATVKGRDARSPSVNATERVSPLRILSAETKPRKWGDVKITQRPLNGWRIDIENIDPHEVRQFSKRPFLEVKTNLPGMESFEIPLRVVKNGGTK